MGGTKLATGLASPLVLLVTLIAGVDMSSLQLLEDNIQINLVTDRLEATIRKKGYVSGIAGGSFLDKKTGFHDAGHGLSIADFILEPGSDEAYRDQIDPQMIYQFNNPWHGKTAKHYIEGPQICTKAKVTSEATHIYDPKNGLLEAYRLVLCDHVVPRRGAITPAVLRLGDYCRAESGTVHENLFTESGCMLLVHASQLDEIVS